MTKPVLLAFSLLIVLCASTSAVTLEMVPDANFSPLEQDIIDQAARDWEQTLGPDGGTIPVVVSKASLGQANRLAETEVQFVNGKPASAHMQLNTDRLDALYWDQNLNTSNDPGLQGKYDALSLVRHELAHALGFMGNGNMADRLQNNRTQFLSCNGQLIPVVDTGQKDLHLDPAAYPNSLLAPNLPVGARVPIPEVAKSMLNCAYGYGTAGACLPSAFYATYWGDGTGIAMSTVSPTGAITGYIVTSAGVVGPHSGQISGFDEGALSVSGSYPGGTYSGSWNCSGGGGNWQGGMFVGAWSGVPIGGAVSYVRAFALTGDDQLAGIISVDEDGTAQAVAFSRSDGMQFVFEGSVGVNGLIDLAGLNQLADSSMKMQIEFQDGFAKGTWESPERGSGIVVPEPPGLELVLASALALAVGGLPRLVRTRCARQYS